MKNYFVKYSNYFILIGIILMTMYFLDIVPWRFRNAPDSIRLSVPLIFLTVGLISKLIDTEGSTGYHETSYTKSKIENNTHNNQTPDDWFKDNPGKSLNDYYTWKSKGGINPEPKNDNLTNYATQILGKSSESDTHLEFDIMPIGSMDDEETAKAIGFVYYWLLKSTDRMNLKYIMSKEFLSVIDQIPYDWGGYINDEFKKENPNIAHRFHEAFQIINTKLKLEDLKIIFLDSLRFTYEENGRNNLSATVLSLIFNEIKLSKADKQAVTNSFVVSLAYKNV
jgi:hypothetical protein